MKKLIIYLILFVNVFLYGVNVYGIQGEAKVLEEKQQKSLIWFGDSRTVYFAKAVYGYKAQKGVRPLTILKKHVVARRSATYDWAQGQGYKELIKRLKKRPDSTVIFNFGVNDIGKGYRHNSKYLNLIRKIHKKYSKTQIYFMSINPVKANSKNPYAKTVKKARSMNQKIMRFNHYIHKNLPKSCKYINTNQKIKFRYIDGLHYKNQTYRDIAYYITGERRID